MTFSYGAALIVLGVAFWHDVKSMIIPNWLTASACAAAWIYSVFTGGVEGVLKVLLGTAIGLLPMLFLYVLKGIGAGDVKLFAALGAWIGAELIFQLFIYSVLIAGMIGVVFMVVYRPFFQRVFTMILSSVLPAAAGRMGFPRVWQQGTKFPFMLAVAPGAAVAWYFY
ncbi:A24 family peptidase [Paenibacillus abyssi]|uniref:Prepilin type IV endopeptidase peptidase domain-containing protein n=2 Tax=Paenibacillus abyssi TaxID=1340531 RepID=A0A917FSN9_9BACL|nr:prepilin peptidase [Paenibacillus abyssi]GGG04823.1 hypothetical protein GCM10010916_22400 [Paenibacillus abyssi]